MIEVSILNPDADQSTTVEVALAGGTAEESDFEFDSPETITFPAGSSVPLTVAVTINDNSAYDAQRTLTFALQNVTNGEIGATDTLEIVIRNNDIYRTNWLWVNEVHLQQYETDSSYIEIAITGQAIPTKMNEDYIDKFELALYDANTGMMVTKFSGSDFQNVLGSEDPLFFVHIANLLEVTPYGISLSYEGQVEMFISYLDSFLALDGPAANYESDPISFDELIISSARESIALTGTGYIYNQFHWMIPDSVTRGTPNPGQEIEIPSSNEDEPELASEFKLHQNYPNPFNPTTVISYQLPVNSEVRLEVFDMLGRRVATLISHERKSAGNHQVTFDASNLSSGVYIYRLSTNNGQHFTHKMLLMK
jgi:hypothetical protein